MKRLSGRWQAPYLVLCALASAATGCCTTFERDWKSAQSTPASHDGLAGAWEGTWESDSNGHHGSLRAVITKCGENQYCARYHATFCKFIPYGYDTYHVAFEENGAMHFQGQTDLGWLAGGSYTYAGWANGHQYAARYRTEDDNGYFRMTRVNPSAAGCATCQAGAAQHPETEGPAEAPPPPLQQAAQPYFDEPVKDDSLPPTPPAPN